MGLKNKVGKFLKSDNSLSLIGNLVFAFFGFANIFILARTFTEDIFGEWVLYLSGMALVEMIRKGITSTPMVRFLAGSSDQKERGNIIGASWVLSMIITVIIVIILLGGYSIFSEPINAKGFHLFFKWYPLLAVLILPLNTGLSVLQAERKFGSILILRSINMALFFIFLLVNIVWLKLDIRVVVWAHIGAHLIGSTVALVMGWSGVKHVFDSTRAALKTQFGYGKFSLGTLIGSNLLKSSDTFILGIMMAQPDVAYYSIPLKLIEIVEIPMRSFVSVAFPTMSKASREGNNALVKKTFYQYAGVVSLLFIPLTIMLFFLAEPLTLLLGGSKYIGSVLIFQIFLVYALLLPLDRFSGITLDAINRPKLNMYKVFFMATANIIGDIIVIALFKSLEAVAVITIVNCLVGVLVGNWFLKKELDLRISRVLPEGVGFLKEFLIRFR